MRRYNVLQALVLSFYSRDLYRDVAKNWQGLAVLYVLLLLALSWMPCITNVYHEVKQMIALKSPVILKQIPSFTIKDGALSIDKPVPYIIKDPKTNLPMIIVDTSGRIKSLANNQATILITEHKFYLRKNLDKVYEYDFSHWRDITLDKFYLNGILRQLGLGLVIGIYLLLVLLSFAYRMLQALLYGTIALLFAKLGSYKVDYSQCIWLAMIAITPAVILSTVLGMLNIGFFGINVIYFVVSVCYLIFAVTAQTRHDSDSTPTP